jgi:hypothetical protein
MSKKENAKPVPAYRIYSVTEKDDGSTSWAEIGVVWQKHKDGKGFTLNFKSRPPADVQIVMREPMPKKVENSDSAKAAA